MRRPHILKRNKNCEMPHEAIWVDTETKPVILDSGEERHELFFGWAAYSRTRSTDDWIEPQWLKFTTIEQFWEWVLSRLHGKSKLYMFAHNWGFDAPVLDTFNVLPEYGFLLKSSVIQSPPVILKWRRKPHTIAMIDTLNIWRMSLKKLGESIGLEKLTMPSYDDSQDEWDTYGKRDVEIIMQACMDWWHFLKSNDLGGFAPTLASQAIRTYRHKFMSHQILIDDNEKALSLARDSLHGGRTECFYIGKVPETIYKLDVNSQYPKVMQSQLMPAKLLGHYKNITPDELQSWLQYYCVSAKCIIKTEQPVFAITHNKRLIFPVGTYTASLSTPEIEYATQNNLITKVLECNIYERAVLFKDYIEYFYNLRLQAKADGNDVTSLLTKLMMNSLFGKFAQRGMIYKQIDTTTDNDIKVWSEYDAETGDIYNLRQYANIIEELERETESRDSHPAIAAHITAHARIQVWGFMQGCGRGNYYYCDTDSLWVNRVGYDRLKDYLDEKELGMLKLEGVHDDVTLLSPKDYIIDGQSTIKGIRANAIKINDNTFEQDRFSTLIGLLRRGDLSAPIVSKVTKRLRRIYTKAIVHTDGTVSPFRLPNDV